MIPREGRKVGAQVELCDRRVEIACDHRSRGDFLREEQQDRRLQNAMRFL